ncbi:MAG: Fe-S oxidoreductase, partial [Blautia sp.]|nr:Fe-S oxidoreductase [Blautia sp.]
EWLVGKHGRKSANECVKCGKWEEVCPQHIKIRDELEKVAAELLG